MIEYDINNNHVKRDEWHDKLLSVALTALSLVIGCALLVIVVARNYVPLHAMLPKVFP